MILGMMIWTPLLINPMSNIQHSSRTDQWATPNYIIEKVICTFQKEIDFDPCSSETANKVVKAKEYLSEADNGLKYGYWFKSPKSVFINPPSGKLNSVGKTKLFWQKLINHQYVGLLEQAIFLGFSVEQLAILQDCTSDPLDFSICIPRKRIKFVNLVDPNHKDRPTHSNFICYIHGTTDNRLKFRECFTSLGKVVLN